MSFKYFYNLKWPSSNINRYMLFVDEGAKKNVDQNKKQNVLKSQSKVN